MEGHRAPDSGHADDDPEVDERGASGVVGGVRADPVSRDHSGLLDTDRSVRRFMEGETTQLPEFYASRIRRELGPAYDYLPEGALSHDPNAYLHATTEPGMATTVQLSGPLVH